MENMKKTNFDYRERYYKIRYDEVFDERKAEVFLSIGGKRVGFNKLDIKDHDKKGKFFFIEIDTCKEKDLSPDDNLTYFYDDNLRTVYHVVGSKNRNNNIYRMPDVPTNFDTEGERIKVEKARDFLWMLAIIRKVPKVAIENVIYNIKDINDIKKYAGVRQDMV